MGKLTAAKNPQKAQINNSGVVETAKMRQIGAIEKHPAFEALFSIKPNILEHITQSMKKSGFDRNKPVILWKEKDVIIDGYTRLKAAENAGLFDVAVCEKSFDSEKEALEYALNEQIGRRNLNDAELVTAVEKLDFIKTGGRKNKGDDSERGRASQVLAEKLGTNSRKVEKIRAIQKDGDEETLEEVKRGEKSIEAAYKETRAKKVSLEKTPLEESPVFDAPEEEAVFGSIEMEETWTDEQIEEEEIVGTETQVIFSVLEILASHGNFDGCIQILQSFLFDGLKGGEQEYIRTKFLQDLPEEIRSRLDGA